MIRSVSAAVILALGVIAAPSPALAQQDALGAAAAKMFEGCRTGQKASISECACVTGMFGGRMKEDEFRILAAITGFIGPGGDIADVAGVQAAAEAERVSQNMTPERFNEVMENFVALAEIGPYADRVCVPLANKTE